MNEFEEAKKRREAQQRHNQGVIDRVQGVAAIPGNLDSEHSAQNPNAMTDPAKELAARLPGPVPWSVDDNGHEEWIADAGGKPLDPAEIVAWANSTAAQLAAKNAEIERLEAESRKHFADGLAFLKRLNTAEGQLAAATQRIASAEKVIAPLALLIEPKKPEGNAGFYSIRFADIRAARSWLTQGKDGGTHG